ncbi:TPA: MbeCy [Vibrio vulnificus]|nr:MbeCy [Vibrio vulnificus]
MSDMKTEVVVIRLTKKERALLDTVKTRPLLADWMRELAFSELNKQEARDVATHNEPVF